MWTWGQCTVISPTYGPSIATILNYRLDFVGRDNCQICLSKYSCGNETTTKPHSFIEFIVWNIRGLGGPPPPDYSEIINLRGMWSGGFKLLEMLGIYFLNKLSTDHVPQLIVFNTPAATSCLLYFCANLQCLGSAISSNLSRHFWFTTHQPMVKLCL